MTCELSLLYGHTWGVCTQGRNKTPFIQAQTSKWCDCCQMSLGKQAQFQVNWSLFLLCGTSCQIITEPGLLQQLNLIQAPTTMANSPWREAQKSSEDKMYGSWLHSCVLGMSSWRNDSLHHLFFFSFWTCYSVVGIADEQCWDSCRCTAKDSAINICVSILPRSSQAAI